MRLLRFCLALMAFASFGYTANEPSAFKAGKLEEKDPYGLTEQEQYILDNKRSLKRLNNRLVALSEKLDAVSTLVVDNNAKATKDILKIQRNLQTIASDLNTAVGELREQTSSISERYDGQFVGYRDDLEEFKKILMDLATLTKFINQNYASKEDIHRLGLAMQAIEEHRQRKKDKLKAMSGYELTKLGEDLMDQGRYNEALPVYRQLVLKNYRPARSHFNLGEIAFYKKQYKEALGFYKTSVGIYAKADYLPLLLLHSGESSGALGNKADAKKFLQAVIANYPQSVEAKRARQLLKHY